MTLVIVAAAVALVVGFAGGFLLRKRSAVWCTDPQCGAQLRCIPCTVKARQQKRAAARPSDAAQPRAAGCR
jgi:hypothetical protein